MWIWICFRNISYFQLLVRLQLFSVDAECSQLIYCRPFRIPGTVSATLSRTTLSEEGLLRRLQTTVCSPTADRMWNTVDRQCLRLEVFRRSLRKSEVRRSSLNRYNRSLVPSHKLEWSAFWEPTSCIQAWWHLVGAKKCLIPTCWKIPEIIGCCRRKRLSNDQISLRIQLRRLHWEAESNVRFVRGTGDLWSLSGIR